LIAGLFAMQDDARFELTAVSFGPGDERSDAQAAAPRVPHFVDVRHRSDGDVAAMLRQSEIDIAVDLKGFTASSRTGILALRPAPVQVNYLGYPGTMGAPYIDYIIADARVIPPDHDIHYTEKVVRLPDAYQVNDATRPIPEAAPTRTDAGLPESGIRLLLLQQQLQDHAGNLCGVDASSRSRAREACCGSSKATRSLRQTCAPKRSDAASRRIG
jgi:predicted O-linked N-acetylglucosamine transferase (SPINDLY family)